jgi:hypothetical protein
MADLQKFVHLLKMNNYIVLEYFSYTGYCNLVKIIHTLSGCLFFISISSEYKLKIDDDYINHYILLRENMPHKEYTSQQLSEYYPNIQITPSGEEIIENISDKLAASYKQPIVVPKHSDMEYINQMERLKFCFKLLEIKLILQTNQYIIQLTNDNILSIFKMENYPKTSENKFYMVISLEQLYSKIETIHTTIQQVEEEFYGILDMNQEKHNQYLSTNYIEYFIKNNDKLLSSKQNLHLTYREISKVLQQLQEKETLIHSKLEKLKRTQTGHNIFKEGEILRQKNELEANYKRIYETKLEILDKLMKLNDKIKNTYLVMDHLGFNLSLAFNELKSELYKMLL